MPGVGLLVVNTGQQATDRRSFLELKSEIARTYNPDDETTLAIAGEAVNSAIRAFGRYNWPWEVMHHVFSIASGTETYSLPQAMKAPIACHLLDSNSRLNKRLGYVPYTTYLTEYTLTDSGDPLLYTFQNLHETGQVFLWPRPASSETAQLVYYRRTPILRSDDAPLDVPLEAEEAILQWAFYEFYKRIGGEFGAARMNVALSEARLARAELVAFVSERGDPVGVI